MLAAAGNSGHRVWGCQVPSSCVPKIGKAEPWVRLQVIPSPRGWRHEAVRPQQGGVNQNGDHADERGS
jgi:hypothetical protein